MMQSSLDNSTKLKMMQAKALCKEARGGKVCNMSFNILS